MCSESSSCKGFTLIELLMVIAVIGILSAIALPVYSSYMEKAKASAAVLAIGAIQRAIAAYYVEANDYPPSLAAIGMDGMKDPWGHPYQYLKIAGATNGSSVSNQANGSGSTSGGNSGDTNGGGTASKNKATGNKGGVDAGGIGTSGGGSTGGGSTGGASGGGTSGGNTGGGSTPTPRKDRNLVPINTDYDLYSMGPDGQSVAPLTAKASRDDIVRAADGTFIGRASDF